MPATNLQMMYVRKGLERKSQSCESCEPVHPSFFLQLIQNLSFAPNTPTVIQGHEKAPKADLRHEFSPNSAATRAETATTKTDTLHRETSVIDLIAVLVLQDCKGRLGLRRRKRTTRAICTHIDVMPWMSRESVHGRPTHELATTTLSEHFGNKLTNAQY